MNKKSIIVLMLPLLIMPLEAIAYSHWSSTITKTYNIEIGSADIEIIKYEVTEYKGIQGALSIEQPDEDTLIIRNNVWVPENKLNIWVYVKNTGTCPVTITEEIEYNNTLFFHYLNYYDVFKKDLDGDGYYETRVDPPFQLNPGEVFLKIEKIGPFCAQNDPSLEGVGFEMKVTFIATQADP